MLCKNTPTASYSTHFNLQNETSNNQIRQEVFDQLHRKGGATCKKECSGARLEVSWSRVAGRGGETDEIGLKEHCFVHRRLQCHSRGHREHFLQFSVFRLFDPISGCSPLTYEMQRCEQFINSIKKHTLSIIYVIYMVKFCQTHCNRSLLTQNVLNSHLKYGFKLSLYHFFFIEISLIARDVEVRNFANRWKH